MGASYQLPCNFVKPKIYTLKAVKTFLSVLMLYSHTAHFSSQDFGLVAMLVPLNWNLSGASSPWHLMSCCTLWVDGVSLFTTSSSVKWRPGGLSGRPERLPHFSVSLLMSTLLHLHIVPSTSNKRHLATICCRHTSLLQVLAHYSAGHFVLKSWALDNSGRVLVFSLYSPIKIF